MITRDLSSVLSILLLLFMQHYTLSPRSNVLSFVLPTHCPKSPFSVQKFNLMTKMYKIEFLCLKCTKKKCFGVKIQRVFKSCFDTHFLKSHIFTNFSPKFFWQFFSWNQSCQQLKSPKPQQFHEFFTPKNRQFSREIKVEFLDKKWRFRIQWFGNTMSTCNRRSEEKEKYESTSKEEKGKQPFTL